MIEIRIVTQRDSTGENSLVYRSEWDPSREKRDPTEEARRIGESNASHNLAGNFPKFFIHAQFYEDPTPEYIEEYMECRPRLGDELSEEQARGEVKGKFLFSTEPREIKVT